MKTFLKILTICIVLGFAVSCGAPATTAPQPTQPPATTAPQATQPPATSAPQPTAVPPTSAPKSWLERLR